MQVEGGIKEIVEQLVSWSYKEQLMSGTGFYKPGQGVWTLSRGKWGSRWSIGSKWNNHVCFKNMLWLQCREWLDEVGGGEHYLASCRRNQSSR